MRTQTGFVPLYVIGIVGLALLGCVATDLIATFGANPARSPLTEIVPLDGAGTPVPLSGERITADNANRMTLLTRLGHGVTHRGVTWSPDGRMLAFPSSYGIYIFDADTLTQIRLIDVPTRVDSIAFSPDATLLALSDNSNHASNNTVQLRRVSDGSLIRELKGESWVGPAVFSPDGALMATWSAKDTLRLWRVSDGTLARELVKLANDGDTLSRIQFSPDWSVLASWSTSLPPVGSPLPRTPRLWRVSDGNLVRELKELGTEHTTFSPDGNLLVSTSVSYAKTASGAPDNRTVVRLWRVSDGSLVRESQVPYAGLGVAVSPDGSLLELSDGNALRLVRVNDGSLVRELTGEAGLGAFSPDGKWLASDDTLRVRRVSDGSLVRESKDWYPIGRAWFSSDASAIASKQSTRNLLAAYAPLRLWQVTDGNPKGIFSLTPVSQLNGPGNYDCPIFNPDKSLLATSSSQNLQLWRVTDGTLVREWKGRVCGVAFSPDKNLIASVSETGNVQLWRVSDGMLARELKDSDRTAEVWFSPDGNLLATRRIKGTVGLWRVSDGSLAREFKGTTSGRVTFSPDSALVAFASDKETMQLWRVSDGALAREFKGEPGGIVTFSPDGSLVASSGSLAQARVGDDTVRVWRVSDGSVRELKGATGIVTFSPDGKLLVARASRELGVLQLWRVGDVNLLREFKGHRDYVDGTAFTQDGNLLLTGSWDGTLGVWGIPGTK